MLKNFLLKLKESAISVVPVTLAIIFIVTIIVPLPESFIINLIIGSVLLIFGVTFFSFGSDSSMIILGQCVGGKIAEKKKLPVILLCAFIIGFIITVAEPDLTVLSNQVMNSSGLDNVWIFIVTVSLGVGAYLALAVLRLYFKIPMNVLLLCSYALIMVLAFFIPQDFVSICFDSGSVTTGAISVPFLMSFGIGLCAIRDEKDDADGFGMIALSSIGPILSVMIMSLFLSGSGSVSENSGVTGSFGGIIANNFSNVAIMILPLVLVFVVFQVFSLRLTRITVLKIIVGFIFSYIGIVLFLTGVEYGYLTLASELGSEVSKLSNSFVLIPIGLFLGALAIIAEPSLHVLKKQVEKITLGMIKQGVIITVISIGVAIAVALSCLMALIDFNVLYILIPVYAVCLVLAFINTRLFTALAFDSGGVATGIMAVSFILPMILGVDGGTGGFGTLALIAAFPILSMQVLGLIYKIVLVKYQKTYVQTFDNEVEFVDFDWQNDVDFGLKSDEIIEFEI